MRKIEIAPNDLRSLGDDYRSAADDLNESATRLDAGTAATALNGSDSDFQVADLRRRIAQLRWKYSVLADEVRSDGGLMLRTADEAERADEVLRRTVEILDDGSDFKVSEGDLDEIAELLTTVTDGEFELLLEQLSDRQLDVLLHNVHSSGFWSNDWNDAERDAFYQTISRLETEAKAALLARLDPATSHYLAVAERLGVGGPPKPTTAEILATYQVAEDPNGIVEWRPFFFAGAYELPSQEAELLDKLGTLDKRRFRDIRDAAFEESAARYQPTTRLLPTPEGPVEVTANFDHTDAYRHAYWSALLAKGFGVEWARAYTRAHESLPGNIADMEAMDLYNNEIGIRIAAQNPDASDAELADLIDEAVQTGEVVVIVGNGGQLAFSDEVATGSTGASDGVVAPGGDELDVDADPAS